MPVRKPEVVAEKSTEKKRKYSGLIDLDFLPKEYVDRIDDIFDSYFSLGMKSRVDRMDSDAPVFPMKISTLSSRELGDILGEYTAWFSYASDKHKYIVVASNFIDTRMQSIIDKELGSMVADKGNIEAKKSKARSSEDYVTLLAYHQKLDGVRVLLDKELNQFDKCIASLSREVSRREHNGGF